MWRDREKLFIAVVCMQDARIFPVSVEILLPQRQPGQETNKKM